MKKIKAKKAAPHRGTLSSNVGYVVSGSSGSGFTTTTNIPAATFTTYSGTTSTHTISNPYPFQASNIFGPTPFSLGFSWGGKSKVISLENGEDVLKLADVFKALLNAANIPYKEETK